MIKLRKGNLIIIGLSDDNIDRLKGNQPIMFPLTDLIKGQNLDPAKPIQMVILNGRTEESIMLSLQELMKPQN